MSPESVFHGADVVWRDGSLVPWSEANLHVMSHVVHYGSSVFEGVRAYRTTRGTAFFRLHDHLRRFLASARVHRMQVPYDLESLAAASIEVVRANGLEACYLRPIAFRGLGAAGLDPADSPVHVVLAAWKWDAYLGLDSSERGVDCCVSSWTRPAPNTHPGMAKAGGNYLNASLIKMEARANGFDEAVALSVDGTVSEASGQNLFLVEDGVLMTPEVDGSFLHGVTRDTVLALANDLGMEVRRARIPREALYMADEVFLTGTATEIVPMRSLDRIEVGAACPGPVTRTLQRAFRALVEGRAGDRHGWLHPIHAEVTVR